MSDVWQRTERLLDGVERPVRYIDREWNSVVDRSADVRFALVYPDAYEVGQSNQAIGILYERLNALEGVAAERAFLPWKDMISAMRRQGVQLSTLESSTPLRECDVVGITLPYELTYTNILEVLDLAGIPLHAADRGDRDPVVVAGGPCAFNPEPVSMFVDAVLLGDGEEAVADIVEVIRVSRRSGREAALGALASVPGVYVPSLHQPGTGRPVRKRILKDLDAVRAPVCPIVPFMDVIHDRVAVEVARGCTRGCRFCHAGMVYRPVRERSADSVVRDVMASLRCTGYEEVSLTSLSTTDHSAIEDVLRRLTRRLDGTATSLSLPSLRVDAHGVDMAALASAGKKTGLTFAPEAGTQRLRDVINKNITEADLLETVHRAMSAGWRRVKLYFMVGLPTETDEDVRAIGQLVDKVVAAAKEATPKGERGALRFAVSVSTFVPKAHTPFQWEPQATREAIAERQSLLRASMPRKGVELSWHDPETSFLEGVLARGGRELGPVIEAAWRSGSLFDAWSDEFDYARWESAFAEAGVDAVAIACAAREPGSLLPWGHLSSGVDEAFLVSERERALRAEVTPDCSGGPCSDCGVCPSLGASVRTAGERRV